MPPGERLLPRRARAFTLIELLIVLVVLSVLLALVAPSLSKSFRARVLDQAAVQLLALIQYGRDEAISQGVPMDVWLNPQNGQYGVAPKTGYPGEATRNKQYRLDPELHFDNTLSASSTGHSLTVAEFAPDGTLEASSNPSLRIADRSSASIVVTETPDGYGYQIQKETR